MNWVVDGKLGVQRKGGGEGKRMMGKSQGRGGGWKRRKWGWKGSAGEGVE